MRTSGTRPSPFESFNAIDDYLSLTPQTYNSNSIKYFGYRPCLGFRPRNGDGSRGSYHWLTYDEINRGVEAFGSGLCNLGLMKVWWLARCSVLF